MELEKLSENQKLASNSQVDWGKHYDYFEIEMREMYRTVAKPQNDSHYEMLKRAGKKFLQRDKIFCEIGFGSGLTLRYAFNHFEKVYGLDISPRNIDFTTAELNKEGYKNFELYHSDIMKFDERYRNKFDVISFIHGLEHFSKEDYPVFFENIRKYLKEGGVFTGALPYKLGFTFRMCPNCDNVFEIDGHVSQHDVDSLSKVFRDNGFEIIHLEKYNIHYANKKGKIEKAAYKFLYNNLFRRNSNSQLEYIVRPVS